MFDLTVAEQTFCTRAEPTISCHRIAIPGGDGGAYSRLRCKETTDRERARQIDGRTPIIGLAHKQKGEQKQAEQNEDLC